MVILAAFLRDVIPLMFAPYKPREGHNDEHGGGGGGGAEEEDGV
jgi:hypothetical protein